jgi:hypothetical protein
MLMQDHREVQKLFRDFHKAHDNDDAEAACQIAHGPVWNWRHGREG